MQRPQQEPINNNLRLIVLDVDDTLMSVDTVDYTDKVRPTFFPEATKRLLDFVKSNPNIKLVVASRVSPTDQIKKSLGYLTDIAHPNIEIYGKEIVSKEPDQKYGIIDPIVREKKIPAKHVFWVDDSLPDVLKAVEKGYTPVLVPCYEAGKMRSLALDSSSYLDCLPSLITNPNLDEFKRQVFMLHGDPSKKVDDKNRYHESVAKSLTGLYEDIRIELLIFPRTDITSQLDLFRQAYSEDNFRHFLRQRADNIISQIKNANSFDGLNAVFKIVLRDKDVLRTEMGVHSVIKSSGNTKRWDDVITELQKRALEIAAQDINTIHTKKAFNDDFQFHDRVYKDIFAQGGSGGFFGSNKYASEYEKMVTALEKDWIIMFR